MNYRYNDFCRYPELSIFQEAQHQQGLNQIKQLPQEKSYDDKPLEKLFAELARPMYGTKVEESTRLPAELGCVIRCVW